MGQVQESQSCLATLLQRTAGKAAMNEPLSNQLSEFPLVRWKFVHTSMDTGVLEQHPRGTYVRLEDVIALLDAEHAAILNLKDN